MYDSNVQYNVVHPYIHCIDDSLTNMGIVPLPDKDRIHPLDREFKGLIKRKKENPFVWPFITHIHRCEYSDYSGRLFILLLDNNEF